MKLRRHHNNKGARQIQRDKPAARTRRLAKRLGIPFLLRPAPAALINLAGYAAVAALACMLLCVAWPRETLFLAGGAFGALAAGLVAIVGGILR